MTGAGLKKWTPHTRSGREVSMASSITEQRRGVGGEDGVGVDGAVELVEERPLHVEVLDHRLDHEVAVGEVGEPGRRRNAGPKGVGVRLRALAPLHLLGQ